MLFCADYTITVVQMFCRDCLLNYCRMNNWVGSSPLFIAIALRDGM